MPKESPAASSLRAGPANPGGRAGRAPPSPPGPYWGLCSPAPSPWDPHTPVSPSPGLAGSRGQGWGTGAARAAVSRGDGGHDASLPVLCLLVASGETPGAAGRLWAALPLQAPCTAPGTCSGSEATPCPQPQTHPGAGTPEELGMPRRRWARGGCGRRCQGSPGLPGEVWGPQSLAGRQHFGFGWGFRLRTPGDRKQAVPPCEHRSPAPTRAGGRKPKTGAAGGHGDLIRHRAVPPRPPVSPSRPAAPGVFPSPVAVPGPRGTSLCQHPVPQSHQETKLGHRAGHARPSPTHVPAPVRGKKKKTMEAPGQSLPGRHHGRCPPRIAIFWKYYTLKLSFWFGRLLAPHRPSPPSLGFWFQCKVL